VFSDTSIWFMELLLVQNPVQQNRVTHTNDKVLREQPY
jgi:hypothetical protein